MTKGLIKKSLRYSYKDGIFAAIMVGFSEQFLIPYCLALDGTARYVAILATLPGFIGSLCQLLSSDAIERLGSRKKIINIFVLLHAFMWIPVIIIPYVFSKNLFLLVIFVTLYVSLNTFSLPAWSSLVSEYIPAGARGRYFGWRNRTLGLIIVVSSFFAGFILWIFRDDKMLGFTIIFGIAFLSRLISWYFLTKMYEPPYRHVPEARFSFLDFIKRTKESNFAKFVLIVGLMNLCVNIAGPFFAVYMLRDLGFSYISYTIVMISATLISLVMMDRWGRHADIVGNVRILKICALFLPFIPILWLFSHNLVYLVSIQIFSGFFWAGFNISASNFIYDAVTPQKRSRCIAYFNVINGTSIFLGAILGGYLVYRLPPVNNYRLLALFLLSGLLRFIPAIGSFVIKEVRAVKRIKKKELFYSIIGIKSIF